MRKSFISLAPLALVAAVGTAFADDSSVTLYGLLDVGVGQIQHSANFDNNFVTGAVPINAVKSGPGGTGSASSAIGMMNGGVSASRFGIRGQEDMGDGLKAVFQLESGISVPNGGISNAALGMATNRATGPNASADSAVSGQLFSRGAYVGLSSATMGTLTFGRQQSFFLDNIGMFDPMGAAQMFSPIGFAGSYGGGGFTDDSRVDNSLKFKRSSGPLTYGVLYKFGGVSGASSAQSAAQANIVYSAGPLAVQGGVQSFRDAFSIANGYSTVYVATTSGGLPTTSVPVAGIKVTAADTRAYMLSAKYAFSSATTVKAGWERMTFNNPSHPGSDQALTELFGQTIVATPNVAAYPNQRVLNLFWVGASHEVTQALTVSAGIYHVTQNAYGSGAAAGCSSAATSGTCSGTLNYDSLSADYRLTKRTDVYAAMMLSRATGGPANGYVDPNNRIIGFGMRHTF